MEERYIESTAAEIVDENIALLLLLSGAETVGDGSSSGLVDDTENVETSDSTGILGGLTLVVVEVCGNGDDGLLNLLAELDLGDLLHLCNVSVHAPTIRFARSHLPENHGRDLLSGELLLLPKVVDLDHRVAALVDDLEGPGLDVLLHGLVIKTATDKTPMHFVSHSLQVSRQNSNILDIEDCVLGVHSSLVLRSLTDETLLGSERNEGRGSEGTLLVGNWWYN